MVTSLSLKVKHLTRSIELAAYWISRRITAPNVLMIFFLNCITRGCGFPLSPLLIFPCTVWILLNHNPEERCKCALTTHCKTYVPSYGENKVCKADEKKQTFNSLNGVHKAIAMCPNEASDGSLHRPLCLLTFKFEYFCVGGGGVFSSLIIGYCTLEGTLQLNCK